MIRIFEIFLVFLFIATSCNQNVEHSYDSQLVMYFHEGKCQSKTRIDEVEVINDTTIKYRYEIYSNTDSSYSEIELPFNGSLFHSYQSKSNSNVNQVYLLDSLRTFFDSQKFTIYKYYKRLEKAFDSGVIIYYVDQMGVIRTESPSWLNFMLVNNNTRNEYEIFSFLNEQIHYRLEPFIPRGRIRNMLPPPPPPHKLSPGNSIKK